MVVVVVVVVLVFDREPGANGSLRSASARVDDAVGDNFTVIAVAGETTFKDLEEEEEEAAVEGEAEDDSGAGVRLLLRGVLLLRRESTMIGDLLPHSWEKKHR